MPPFPSSQINSMLTHIVGIDFHPIITMAVHQDIFGVCMHDSTFFIPSLLSVVHHHQAELEYLYASHLHHVEREGHSGVKHMLDAND